jgi:hypothetical protein
MLIAEKKVDPVQLSIHLEEEKAQQDQERTITGDIEKASVVSSSDIKTDDKNGAKKPSKPSFFKVLHVFKNPQFLSLTVAEFTASIGYLIPLYYMQSKWKSIDACSAFCRLI